LPRERPSVGFGTRNALIPWLMQYRTVVILYTSCPGRGLPWALAPGTH